MTSTAAGGVTVIDLPKPVAGPPLTLSGPPVPPVQCIFFYSSDDWEEFIKEWALGLAKDYVQVKRLGGTGDQGIDVAAFKSGDGLEGPWDCFQGKRYSRELRPGDAYAEMLKLFRHVDAGDYIMPDTYQFLAPKGCGGTLNRLLSTPTKLREGFLSAIEDGEGLGKDLDENLVTRLRDLAEATDFTMFKSVELHDALETHARTKYHLGRFGSPVLRRSEVAQPPEELGEHETNYVAELRKVYVEGCGGDLDEAGSLTSHLTFGDHFKRQRFSFYSAEALRMDVRDAVPDGTFERLQDDVHAGVVEIVNAPHESGMSRLTAVLTHSTLLDLSSHPLVSLARPEDRKGICHQLANDSRIAWTPGEQ